MFRVIIISQQLNNKHILHIFFTMYMYNTLYLVHINKESLTFASVSLLQEEKINKFLWNSFFGNDPVANEDYDIQERKRNRNIG